MPLYISSIFDILCNYVTNMGEKLTNIFMQLFCEKNSDGTLTLRLKGRDLYQRIGKRIVDDDMYNVSYFLLNNPKIFHLDLCYNDIGDDGIELLVKMYLCKENNLETLNLVGCSFGWKAIQILHSCASTIQLTTLRVTGNKIGGEGAKYLAMLLEDNNTLKYLDLGDTDQTLSSIPYIMSVLRQDIGSNTTLKALDISRIIPTSEYYQYDPGHLAEQIGNMLKVNSTLIEIHAQKCQFDGHDMELLLFGMKFNKTLLFLDLGYNRIGDHGIELLANWLKTKPNLLGLNIAGNGIGNNGARALSFDMPSSKLRLLDISSNKITDVGMIDILNSIKKPYMLRLFYIWGNTMTQKSLKIIERMLLSEVLEQENIDIRLYTVDNVLYHAYYPTNRYKHKYYCVMDHGCPIELKIKRNKIEHEHAQPRSLVKFQYYPRVPTADDTLPPLEKPC